MELKLAFNCYVSGSGYKRIQVTAAITVLPQARREMSSTYHLDFYLVIQGCKLNTTKSYICNFVIMFLLNTREVI